MTVKQSVLKGVYPILMWFNKALRKNNSSLSNVKAWPIVPIYNLSANLINGAPIDFNTFKGKKVLLVNTASDCGYTGQYEGLQNLYDRFKENLVVLGIPSNDFKNQEKGNNASIENFCDINYSINFPLLQKTKVIKGPGQSEIYQWLTDKNKNGWNDQPPTWNFCKYIIDEKGKLTHFFASSVEPGSKEVINAISDR